MGCREFLCLLSLGGKMSLVRVSGLSGHIRGNGYEAPKVASLKPRKYIHSGLVDWKIIVNSGPQEAEDPFGVNHRRQEAP